MTVNNLLSTIMVFALSLTLTACGGSKEESVKLQGAGASFPAPLYLKWFKSYSSAHPNIQVDYQSVGSGSGVKSFMDRTLRHYLGSEQGAVRHTPRDLGDSLYLIASARDRVGLWGCGGHLPERRFPRRNRI